MFGLISVFWISVLTTVLLDASQVLPQLLFRVEKKKMQKKRSLQTQLQLTNNLLRYNDMHRNQLA